MMKLCAFLAVVAIVFGASSAADLTASCLGCICQIESNCNTTIGCIMDEGSLSCGPYQIKDPYWRDCGNLDGDWQRCAGNKDCAERCIRAYVKRYGESCTGGRPLECQDYARIHNGGPDGCKIPRTETYWTRVNACCNGQNGCR